MLLGSHVAGSTGRIGVTRLVGWSYGGLFYFPVLSLLTRWVESGTEYVGQWGCLILSDLALWLSLPFPFLSIDLPHMCCTCLCVPAPGSSLRACSLVPFFHLSVLVLVGNSFLSPPFLREKIKEELIHIIHIHNPIIGCMIHQLTLQEGHTLLAHYPLRFLCHGVTMSLHISFWRCSFLFSSSMQVS